MVEAKLNCESDTRPNSYTIENILNGKCDIVLHDNIEEHSREDENNTIRNYFSYDVYRIIKNSYRENLSKELSTKKGFSMWLNFAKEQYENQAEEISLEERLSTAEAVIAEILGGEV